MAKPKMDSWMAIDFCRDQTILKLNLNISSENIHIKHSPSEIDAIERELDAVVDYFKTKLRDNMRR